MENSFIQYEVLNHKVLLLAEKCIYIEDMETLIVADMHLGKAGHLREQGVAVPEVLAKSDLEKLGIVIERMKAERLIILGDLFHNTFNSDWEYFREWRNKFSKLDIKLILGNHDILPESNYKELKIELCDDFILYKGLKLKHELPDKIENGKDYLLCGHVHPAVKLSAKGKQYMRLPCFYFTNSYGLMPAFGELTGSYTVNPGKDDNVFVISENKIFEIVNGL